MLKNRHIYSFCLSTITLLLTSVACVSIDVQKAPEKELTFSTVLTKVGETPAVTSLGIFANATPDQAGSNAVTSWVNSEFWTKKDESGLYINNGLFAYFNGAYAGADPNDITKHVPYFWPSGKSLIFSAYSPHQSEHPTIIRSAKLRNQSQAEYMSLMQIDVVLHPQMVKVDESNSPLDLLWADPSNVNNGKTAGRQSTALPVVLSHAQSKVTFRINNPQGEYTMSARLLGCVNSATFYSGKKPGWLPNFTDQANLLKDYDLFADVSLDATPVETSLIVIPMSLNGEYKQVDASTDKVVTLQLELVSNDGVGRETVDIPMTKYTETWEYGKHYTYSITINNRKIQFAEPTITSRDIPTNL